MQSAELRQRVFVIMQEITAIAAKKAVVLPEHIIEKSLQKAFNFPSAARTSYQRDVEAWPKPNEGDLYGDFIPEGRDYTGRPDPGYRTTLPADNRSSKIVTNNQMNHFHNNGGNSPMRIYQVDAFTQQIFKGNPAGVCILPPEKMNSDALLQNIALEMNLSETAFLSKERSAYRLRWFTPSN